MSEFRVCDFEGHATGWRLHIEFSVGLLGRLSSGRFKSKDIKNILLDIKQKALESNIKTCLGTINTCEKATEVHWRAVLTRRQGKPLLLVVGQEESLLLRLTLGALEAKDFNLLLDA